MHKRTAFHLFVVLIVSSLIGGVGTAAAQSGLLAEIDNLEPREHAQDGFILTSKQTVEIEAIGAGPDDSRDWRGDRNEDRDLWQANAWILDANTREVVWNLETSTTDRVDNDLMHFEGSLLLPAGTYEVHYGSFLANSLSYTVRNGVTNVIRRVLDGFNDERGRRMSEDALDELRITVRGNGDRARWSDLRDAAQTLDESAFVALSPYRSEADRYGFELSESTELELLAFGELDREGQYDYGWILDAETGDRIWEMEYRNSDHAGGADKNRVVQESLRLPAGKYVAYFVMDDSHDAEEWNTMPPFDTAFSGLTISVRDRSALGSVRSFEYEPVPSQLTIVSITGAGDDELLSEGFSIDAPMDVNVYAIGEGTRSSMADYAWIVDTNSRRRVWSMEYRDTEHAGGADKNRLFDDHVRLEAGNYMVYYRSDGSHAFGDWNAGPPAEAAFWGVSLYASNDSDFEAVGPNRRDSGENVIAELVRIGDDDREQVRFELKRESKIRIIAVGEGSSGDMHDGAWIEDRDSGDTVWEQTYRMTDHAGGAQKNRIFDGTIVLPAGDYLLRYSSDGSHSYEDWNADPPNDPDAWGVTLLRGK